MFTFIFPLLLLELSKIDCLNPAAINYCKLNCKGEKNPGCDCYSNMNSDAKIEELDDFMSFRTEILDKHNELRNHVGGDGANSSSTSASNMNALSYDLEMEHLARCAGHKAPESAFDMVELDWYSEKNSCRRSSKFDKYSQTIDQYSTKNESVAVVEKWYMRGIDTVSNPFTKGKTRVDIVNLLWWSHTHVGCARMRSIGSLNGFLCFLLICNYGGTTAGITEGMPIYLQGAACSACPQGVQCNSRYKGLCGKIGPIPKDKPLRIRAQRSSLSQGSGAPEFGKKFVVLYCMASIALILRK